MTPPDSRAIVTTRVVDAPRERVFAVWTDPAHVSNWWGPRGFSTTTIASDFRVGGLWRFIMHGPDGTDYDNRILYREIVRPSRLAYLHGSDKDNDPEAFEATVTFEVKEGKTLITLSCVMPTQAQRDMAVKHGAIEGANDTLGRFEEQVALLHSVSPLVISRTLNAPRERVWRAWTEAEHLARWWGPNGFTSPRCETDTRVGGAMRIDMRAPDGTVLPMFGRWEALEPHSRLVLVTRLMDDAGKPQFEIRHTIRLDEKGGRTILEWTSQVLYMNASMEFHLEGQTQGTTESIDRLQAVVERGG